MFSRRQILQFSSVASAAQIFANHAMALDYPAKPVRVVITTAPGGSSDIVSRTTSQFLSDRLGQTFIIDNRPGAGGNVAADLVYRAPADGYTLLSISKGNIFTNLLYDNLSFDFMRDFTPVAGIANGSLVMLVHPSIPVKTLAEFIAYAKKNPGKINFASAGNGSDPHLSGELLKMMTGIEMTHVPYRGGAIALTDLLGGNVQVMFSNLPVADYIKTGKLLGLGVTAPVRTKDFPDIPAITEIVPGFEVGAWYAYVMRKATPADVIQTINREMAVTLADPKVQSGLAVLNATPMSLSISELNALFAKEHEKWSKVIKAANIKPE